MVRKAVSPFEKACNVFSKVAARNPVTQVALMESLNNLDQLGNMMVKDKELGIIKYALGMTAANAAALSANEAGTVQPPLLPEEVVRLTTQNETLQIFIDNDPGTAVPQVPTDTSTIPTSGRKGA